MWQKTPSTLSITGKNVHTNSIFKTAKQCNIKKDWKVMYEKDWKIFLPKDQLCYRGPR